MYVQPDKYVQAGGLFIFGFSHIEKWPTGTAIKGMGEETGA